MLNIAHREVNKTKAAVVINLWEDASPTIDYDAAATDDEEMCFCAQPPSADEDCSVVFLCAQTTEFTFWSAA